MVLDVVDDLARRGSKTRRLAGVVDLLRALPLAAARGELEVAQRAGQADAHEVCRRAQFVVGTHAGRRGGGVAVVGQAVAPALALHHGRAAVTATTAAHRIAPAVAEAADATAAERALRRLHEARAVRNLTEIPALADQVDVTARGLVHRGLQPLHRGARLVAHQIEAKAVDVVVARPDHGRIDHQPRHHGVLGGGVVATGAAFDHTLRIQPLVVAGHDAVEHALRLLARRGGVVVDHVHADAQPRAVQRLHHRAELDHARGRLHRIAGVAAFGRGVVPGVVAPVEAVLRGVAHHRGLLRGAVGCGGGQRCRIGRGAATLRHAGDVEDRQQVHVGHAGRGECAQVFHAGAAGLREGEVLAALGRRHGVVADREVAHMQLVDHEVGVGELVAFGAADHLGPLGAVPEPRLEFGTVQAADPGAL